MRRGQGFLCLLALPTVLALFGCETDSTAEYWTSSDSAGVRIVLNEPTTVDGPAIWTLSASPDVLIEQKESDADQTWTYVRSAFWLPDTSIGVGVSDPPFLRVYAPDGTLTNTIAPRGEGPGELREGIWAGAWGDSLLVRGLAGFAVFDASGRFVSTRQFPGGESAEVLAAAPDGWIVQVQKRYDDMHGEAPPQVMRDLSFLRVSLGGEIRDTVLTFETPLRANLAFIAWGNMDPAASDGQRIVLLGSDTYEIREFVDGRLTSITRAPIPTVDGYSDAHFEEVREAFGPYAPMILERDQEDGRMSIPPAVSLRIDDSTGRVWVRRTDDGSKDLLEWDVFDAGVWIATLEVPREFSIERVRDNRILGVWTDEFDVTGVRVYSVVEVQ